MYQKINDEPIPIECVPHEHITELDYEPSFWFENHRYMISDFLRTHDNPWCVFDVPEYIHAILMDGSARSYENPFYLQLIGDSHVNIYMRKDD